MAIKSGTRVEAQGYGWTHAGRDRAALRNIDLVIEPGEKVLLCGDSGSGKSTLLAAIAGVLGGPDEGEQQGVVRLVDSAGHAEQPGGSIPVGLVLQDPDSQVIAARVGDDVAFGCENLGLPRHEIWKRVDDALDSVGLSVGLDFPTAQLSGGQKQRLALAGVMAMGAGLILLDEPTANLDPAGARAVRDAVAKVADVTGATLIVVEHKFEHWAGLLDRAVLIEDGAIAADGDFAAVTAGREITGLPAATPVAGGDYALWAEELVTQWGPARNLGFISGASNVVTGANGAGKTTLLMTMAGLLPAKSGEIGVAESVRSGLKGSPLTWKSRQLARRIGTVFQNPEHQFVTRSVYEELLVSSKVMGRDVDAARVEELMERLRLSALAEANPFTLSGGEKRRLSVATALVASPAVLLLDEPTFGQDPTTFVELVGLLRGLVDDGVTIASVTHDELFIRALGDWRVEITGTGRDWPGEGHG